MNQLPSSKIALGSAQFGLPYGISNHSGQISQPEITSILDYASKQNINTIDTAIAYGDAEERLGQYQLHDWQVITKLPKIPKRIDSIEVWVIQEIEKSLKRLNIVQLYGVLLHRPKELLNQNGSILYKTLSSLQDQGLIKKIGVSIYAPDELALLNEASINFDLIQLPFNILDKRWLENDLLMSLSQKNIEIHVRSVFLQGLLLMSNQSRAQKFDRWALLWSQWKSWLLEHQLTPLQACLRYVMSFKEINKIIVGIDSLSQFEEIVLASCGAIPEVPDYLKTNDPCLLNPTNWNQL